MRVIKRYSNRKLYDTEEKKYVTLDQVAELIRKGVDVKVVDNESGEDLTTVTLSQILVEQEKRREGGLSKSFLSQFIKGSTSTVGYVRRTVSHLFGGAYMSEEAVRENVDQLVKEGEISPEEGRELVDDLIKRTRTAWREFEVKLEERVAAFLAHLNIPSKKDLDELATRLDALARKVEALERTLEPAKAERPSPRTPEPQPQAPAGA